MHLQLVDHTLLAGSRLGRVIDLGANLEWIGAVSRGQLGHNSGESGHGAAAAGEHGPDRQRSPELWPVVIEYTGPFLTAPGGYPSDRDWAPKGSVREIAVLADAEIVVAGLARAGASRIKVTMNSDAGPVLDDESIRAVVSAAAAHGLPVVVHAEGAGQAQRAASLGANLLAHAPFTERLSDDEIAAQAASVQWISTLAIHDDPHRAIAIDNVRRFAEACGTVLYGTDMGNGDIPVDLCANEIDALREAGIEGIPLLHTLAPLSALADDAPLLFLPDGDPVLARPLTPADLES